MDADSFRRVVGEKWKDTATEQVCSSRFGRLVGLDGYKRPGPCGDGDDSRSGDGSHRRRDGCRFLGSGVRE